jgi:hypothetical protein
MAAYTELSGPDIEALTAAFAVPPAVAWEPTAEGIENTNYFLTTRDESGNEREWVLTRVEQADTPVEEVAAWLAHLNARGLPVPAPAVLREPRDRARYTTLHEGQPVVLVQRLAGGHPERFEPWMCAAAGTFLARLHRAGAPAGVLDRPHVRDLAWLTRKAERLRAALPRGRRLLLDGALRRQRLVEAPRGLGHPAPGRGARGSVPRQRPVRRRPPDRRDRLLPRRPGMPDLRPRRGPERLVHRSGTGRGAGRTCAAPMPWRSWPPTTRSVP